MQYRLFCSILFAGLTLGAAPLLSHEFWIEPEKYQVNSGATVVASLRNGQEFNGAEQPYLDHRIARFDVIKDGSASPYMGRMGDMPAFSADETGDGLTVIIHQTQPQTLTYDTWEGFQAFIDHKGFAGIPSQHTARGLPDAGFTEQYTRYAKALVAIGNGEGSDLDTGMETEIVALANPYTDDLAAGFPVQVLYQGNPRPQVQVEVFAKTPDGSVTISTRLTDSQGKSVIPVLPGHTYLLDAVVLRPAPEDKDHVWESLWAALTFAVPLR
ncbi:DUF4198 domain-containing protein [Leisingera sp. HS039]|uniref:DUF4198 domain-containing protein n=1 Tax=unclassified Leisingera TaxID=2614906 RepID=UPI001070ED2A|nr:MULTISPECIES: DUF4198 domain-containing protein [unclassified Leisingera]MBQ4823059.1 DUF4198 domain-containing protein [Leisingera sp. HS039]QBR36293.1 DUF4198 domain-containing protein [Leisingera sp. NJS201]